MKNLLIISFCLTTCLLFGQNMITWVGGSPGKETAWNEARNWDTNRVPDEFSFVIIMKTNSGHYAQPVITGEVEVAYIEIQAGACLKVMESGEILIDGTYTQTNGISTYGGQLINEGTVHLRNIPGLSADMIQMVMKGNGMAYINDSPVLNNSSQNDGHLVDTKF